MKRRWKHGQVSLESYMGYPDGRNREIGARIVRWGPPTRQLALQVFLWFCVFDVRVWWKP